MKDKLQKKIKAVQYEHAEEVLTEHLASHDQKDRDRVLVFLGGINTANRIAQSLSANVMRSLIQFQENKEYEILGYENFVAFLNESELAPMSKSQFYDRKTLLEKEGDVAFDLLNSLKLPVSTRKLLGKGNIQLDGNTVIVKDEEGNETSVDIDDRARLMDTLTTVADSAAELRKKLEKEKEKVEKAEEKNAELEEENDRILAYKKAEFTDFHAEAQLNLASAFKLLEHQARQLKPAERKVFAPKVFEMIAGLMDDLSVAYDRKSWTNNGKKTASNGAQSKDETDELIDEFLETEDENDLELAKQM